MRETLDPIPLFTKRSGKGGLEDARPDPPYALLLVVSRPHPDRDWESLVGFEIHAWGAMHQLESLEADLAWLDGERAGDFGTARGIIYYRYGNTQIIAEPTARMPDGGDLFHYRDPYRASYGDTNRLEAMLEVVP